MNTKTYVGNLIIVLNGPVNRPTTKILLGRRKPKSENDEKRKRKRVAIGLWTPLGGETRKSDKSQREAAQRELREETRLTFPIEAFEKVAILRGYIDSSGIPVWLVHIYLVAQYLNGQKVVPSEEYDKMRWFPIFELPEKMMRTDKVWLSHILDGKKASFKVFFDGGYSKPIGVEIKPAQSF